MAPVGYGGGSGDVGAGPKQGSVGETKDPLESRALGGIATVTRAAAKPPRCIAEDMPNRAGAEQAAATKPEIGSLRSAARQQAWRPARRKCFASWVSELRERPDEHLFPVRWGTKEG